MVIHWVSVNAWRFSSGPPMRNPSPDSRMPHRVRSAPDRKALVGALGQPREDPADVEGRGSMDGIYRVLTMASLDDLVARYLAATVTPHWENSSVESSSTAASGCDGCGNC
jgi:hypothetical protein